jgi:polysaccharide biosynthesis protein PslG
MLPNLTKLILLCFALLWLVSCNALPGEPPPTPTPDLGFLPEAEMIRYFDSPEYGVHLAQWWHPDALERDIALTQALNFQWIKQKFAWRDIEGIVKGAQDWYRPDLIVDQAERTELKLLVRLDQPPVWAVGDLAEGEVLTNQPPLDLTDYGDFCGLVAERYRGRIAAYQVWNEPNLSREWGGESPDPAAYTAMLKVCYEAIKAADPSAIVISAGLAPTSTMPPLAMPDVDFLQAMYDAGAAAYFDVLGLNAPGYKAPPEMSPAEVIAADGYGGHGWNTFRHVETMRALMVANGDAIKQIAILEMGWTTDPIRPDYAWHAVTEEQQGEYLARAYQFAAENWRPWIGLMVTIFLADQHWTADDEQYWWSITLPDGTPRPAYYALQQMRRE